MPDNFKDHEDMVTAYRDHAGRRRRLLEAEPVSSEPQVPYWTPKHLQSRSTTAEESARTAFGVTDYTDTMTASERARWDDFNARFNDDYGLTRRIASDNRAYLVGSATLALGVTVMLLALYFLGPAWLRPTSPKIAVDNAGWCSHWRDALSCPNAQSNADK